MDPPTGTQVLPPGHEIEIRLVKQPCPDVAYFEDGDVFTEHDWRDRWYSIKEVRDGGGALKGWYCDVARPATVDEGVGGDPEGSSRVRGGSFRIMVRLASGR